EQCRELGVSALAGVESDPVCDLEDEAYHIAAVATRVRIVRFDDVPEEHGRAPIRMAELECVVDTNLALAREVGKEPDQRQREDDQRRMPTGAERREERDRRESRVEGPDPDHEAQEAERRHTEAQAVA